MRKIVTIIALLISVCACAGSRRYDSLCKSLTEYVEGKDASIGIAIVVNGTDTVSVNGNKEFPMLSVYKFPIALALAEHYRHNKLSLDHPIAVGTEDLRPDTYSPLAEKIRASSAIVTDTLMIPTSVLLRYMLQQSDNNASDIILRELTGAGYVDRYLNQIGVTDVKVRSSEAEMYADHSLCYINTATPIGMAALMSEFDSNFHDDISVEIKQMMETCETGDNRLALPLKDAVIGHKTGTGFMMPDGRLMAVNDAGYVHIGGDCRYSIAVFIENSGYDMAKTERIISTISSIVKNHINNREQGS